MDDNWGYPYFRKPPFLQMGKTNGGTRFSMAHGKRDEYHCLIAIAKWFTHHFSHSHGYMLSFINYKQELLLPGRTPNKSKNLSAMFDSSKQDEVRYTEELVLLFKGLKASVCDQLKEAGHL